MIQFWWFWYRSNCLIMRNRMAPKSLNLDHWLARLFDVYKVYLTRLFLCSSNWNSAILVPFDPSHRDESNGTKIVKFGQLDHKLLQNLLKFSRVADLCRSAPYLFSWYNVMILISPKLSKFNYRIQGLFNFYVILIVIFKVTK